MTATSPRTPVIVAGRRTPITGSGRALAGRSVDELAAVVLRAVMADLPADRPPIDDVVLGNCTGPGGDVARVAAVRAGLGTAVPGVTVDRQCGSGLEAVLQAATAVLAGTADLVLAGGAESASTGRPGRARFAPPPFADPEMGVAADDLATAAAVTRERQDAYAVRSHRLTLAARESGVLAAEVVPVGDVVLDDRPRRLDLGVAARAPAAFVTGGTVTAANSCGISDGAAAVAVVPESVRARWDVPGLAVRGWARTGVDPALPGLGPVSAVAEALRRSGCTMDDVTRIELVEAFAAQVLACTDAWGLDPLGSDSGRVAPDGGALALGHPWGASGAMVVVRLLHAATGPGRFVAACAVGGGQGVAAVLEPVR